MIDGMLSACVSCVLWKQRRFSNCQVAVQVAVIVNDMAEVGIDAEAVRGGQTAMRQSQERIVELSNGCICCTLRDDLLQVSHRCDPIGLCWVPRSMQKA